MEIRIIKSFLRIRIVTLLFWVLTYLVLVPVISPWYRFSTTSYRHIHREDLERELYKNVPLVNTTKPQCTYTDILTSEIRYDSWLNENFNDNKSISDLQAGSYVPEHCSPLFSVALLVPYYKRPKQLHLFLHYIHKFLRKQKLHYKVFVVEQVNGDEFNKGISFNVGAQYAIFEGFPCLILHDVDMLPLDASNLYACLNEPRHLSAAIRHLRYALPYEELIGGVLGILSDHYIAVDGFSNKFYDWGGEDDEFYSRLVYYNFTIKRFPIEMARYSMLRHKNWARNKSRWKTLQQNNLNQFRGDGLSNVQDFVSNLRVKPHDLSTWIEVTKRVRRHFISVKRYKFYIIVFVILWSIANFKYMRRIEESSGNYMVNSRDEIIRHIKATLQEELKKDKGTGCEMPKLDPFAPEIMKFQKKPPTVVCGRIDWVKCHLSKCRVVPQILDTLKDITCTYTDILFKTDWQYTFGPPKSIRNADVYNLQNSDHVKVSCTGNYHTNFRLANTRWRGTVLGFRNVATKIPPKGRENTLNVLILAFDSAAKNGFIRSMPTSYKVLTEELHAVILNSFNVLGDGTPATLFPLLTGKTELELPESRRSMKNSGYCDNMPFIFYKLKEDGYRTAFFEDLPGIGTFQYRFHGFKKQPADHYLRAYLTETAKMYNGYCIGDTHSYKIMLNITDQFFRLDKKRFAMTFISDISHGDFNMISMSDKDVAEFLRNFQQQGRLLNTLLIVMGDHGPRYASARMTLQGKLEERLPLMAIRLPEILQNERPDALQNLKNNIDTLTTPHDIHATILDVIGMTQYWNTYKVTGADMPRAMTLLQTVPKNRSCSEAGIEPHWCACINWDPILPTDPMYQRVAIALLDHINSYTEQMRSKCALRTITSIEWVMRQRSKRGMLAFVKAADEDGYVGRYEKSSRIKTKFYQAKIVVEPGEGVYEGLVSYDQTKFHVSPKDISRTNSYGNEPDCISRTHPHLNMFCYCKV